MYYLVGLGNPQKEHEKNRHNVGFMALDFIIESFGLTEGSKSLEFSGRFGSGKIEKQEMVFLYPETFMNNSGSAVKKMVPKNEIAELVVIYDDIALPLGEVKISFDRGDGGHNGIKSIIGALNSKEFIRVRIGVAQASFWTGKTKVLSGEALPNFVLGNFTNRELAILKDEVFPKVRDAVSTILREGHVKAMNVFN